MGSVRWPQDSPRTDTTTASSNIHADIVTCEIHQVFKEKKKWEEL